MKIIRSELVDKLITQIFREGFIFKNEKSYLIIEEMILFTILGLKKVDHVYKAEKTEALE